MVLIFNGAQVLVAVTRSLHSAAELTKGNLQAISFCCTGKYVCSGGLYFRHLHPDVEIELADLGTLMLKDYDAWPKNGWTSGTSTRYGRLSG